MIQTTIPQILNWLWRDLLQKKENLVLQSWSNPAWRKLVRRSFEVPTNPVYYSKEAFLVGERKWNDVPACRSFNGDSFSAEVSKFVMKLVRHHDQDERETDGAVHWNSMGPKLRKAFQKAGGQQFSDSDWLQYAYEGSNKTRSELHEFPKFLIENSCHSRTHWWGIR